jgi:hypothetical protein
VRLIWLLPADGLTRWYLGSNVLLSVRTLESWLSSWSEDCWECGISIVRLAGPQLSGNEALIMSKCEKIFCTLEFILQFNSAYPVGDILLSQNTAWAALLEVVLPFSRSKSWHQNVTGGWGLSDVPQFLGTTSKMRMLPQVYQKNREEWEDRKIY